MNYSKVVSGAWSMLWRYRALWLFGVLLALTATGTIIGDVRGEWQDMPRGVTIRTAESSVIRLGGEGVEIDLTTPARPAVHWEGEWPREAGEWITEVIVGYGRLLVVAAIAALALTLVAGAITRYVGEAALIRMVDHTEATGERLGLRQGFRLGWSRAAWRLFFLDVVVYGALTLATILLFSLALSPLALWVTGSTAAGVVGSDLTFPLLIAVALFIGLAGFIAWVILPLFRRASAVDGLGVRASIRRGLSVARKNWRPVVVAWFICAVIGVFSALLLGSVIGVWRFLSLAGLFTLFLGYISPWLSVGAAGVGVLALLFIAPFLFARGLVEVFLSSLWTLTYREVCSSEQVACCAQPQIEPSALGAAQTA